MEQFIKLIIFLTQNLLASCIPSMVLLYIPALNNVILQICTIRPIKIEYLLFLSFACMEINLPGVDLIVRFIYANVKPPCI